MHMVSRMTGITLPSLYLGLMYVAMWIKNAYIRHAPLGHKETDNIMRYIKTKHISAKKQKKSLMTLWLHFETMVSTKVGAQFPITLW